MRYARKLGKTWLFHQHKITDRAAKQRGSIFSGCCFEKSIHFGRRNNAAITELDRLDSSACYKSVNECSRHSHGGCKANNTETQRVTVAIDRWFSVRHAGIY